MESSLEREIEAVDNGKREREREGGEEEVIFPFCTCKCIF